MKRIFEFIDCQGFEGLHRKVNNYLDYLSTPKDDPSLEYVRKRRYLGFLNDKNEYSPDSRCENHIVIRDGIIFYKE